MKTKERNTRVFVLLLDVPLFAPPVTKGGGGGVCLSHFCVVAKFSKLFIFLFFVGWETSLRRSVGIHHAAVRRHVARQCGPVSAGRIELAAWQSRDGPLTYSSSSSRAPNCCRALANA